MSKFFLLVFILGVAYITYKVFFTNWIDLLIEKFNLKRNVEDLVQEKKSVSKEINQYENYLENISKTALKQKSKLNKK